MPKISARSILIPVCAVAILVGSCSRFLDPAAKSDPPKPDKSSTRSGQPASDARENLKSALTALVGAKSFRVHLTHDGKPFLQIEFAAPDRFHTKGEVNATGPAALGEMIIIGSDTYVRSGDSWQKASPQVHFADLVNKYRVIDVGQEMAKYDDIQFVGNEDLNAAPTLVYQFRKEQKPGKVWIGANDGLPHKFEYEGSGPAGGSMTATYEYDAEIRIEPPI